MNEAVIDALACHRLTRLVVSDTITETARERLIRALYARRGDQTAKRLAPPVEGWAERARDDGPDAPFLAGLISCRWCAGMWCAFGVVILRRFVPRVWSPIARALAFSSAAGLLGVLEHFVEPQEVEIVDEEEVPG